MPGPMSRSPVPQTPLRRRGLTVLELLVAVAILTILAALVLPALFRAREAARRLHCQNNLHQIGVALTAYHLRHGSLPPGWIEDGATDTGWGWAAMLLPHLDQSALYEEARFDRPVGDACNSIVRLAGMELFRCPSDAAPASFALYREVEQTELSSASVTGPTAPDVLFELASANYVGVFGTSDPDTVPGETGDGAFIANRGTRFFAFRDGMGSTMLVGERAARQLLSTWVGMHPEGEEGPARVVGYVDHAPNDPSADECEFSSRHAGGSFFLMADGAVRFVSQQIDRTNYQRMATLRDRP
jgi:prepilin-type N-terminal cleavage/methylation domain-containing protein